MVAIALGEWQTAVISANGRVWYWGLNGIALACPAFSPVCYPVPVYLREPKLTTFLPPNATAVAMGYSSVYALANGGAAYSIGTAASPADLPLGLSGIAPGAAHACAFRANGEIKCLGPNSTGALGDGTSVARSAPITSYGFSPALRPARAVEFDPVHPNKRLMGGSPCTCQDTA